MPVIPQLHELLTHTKHIIDPIPHSKFMLDSSGVAGFFGGDSAVHGMATVNLYDYRRWGGWYNTPGSFDIAKQYGRLASSRFWNGLFPGGTHNPAELFGLDGEKGPPFIAARSGSNFVHTGHLAHLLACKVQSTTPQSIRVPGGRVTNPSSVTIIDLPDFEGERIVHPKLCRSHSGLFAVVPIAVSIAACVLCALDAQWYAFASILVGMIAHGSACFVLGTGRLAFKHPNPATGAPAGDGILREDAGVIVLRGPESVINSFTRGRFLLDFSHNLRKPSSHHSVGSADGQTNGRTDGQTGGQTGGQMATGRQTDGQTGEPTNERTDGRTGELADGRTNGQTNRQIDEQTPTADSFPTPSPLRVQPNQYFIGIPSLFLTAQFLVQLLLIPQARLFGQLMFVSTLAVSWMYNAYLSSLDLEDILTTILLKNVLKIDPDTPLGQKYQFGSWTSMTVFACLALQPNAEEPLEDPGRLLKKLIPNRTPVWEEWRTIIAKRLVTPQSWEDVPDLSRFDEKDRKLLTIFLDDAVVAYKTWSGSEGRSATT